MNSVIGSHLKLGVTGASHAPEMTFRLENFPSRVRIDADALRAFMERRAPGRDRYSTARRETDEIEFRSGFANGVTTGAPIVGAIANRDMRPGDYGAERTIPRPGHADFGQWIETGRIPTGGGKNSGRLTAPLCAAGGLCKQFLAQRAIEVEAELAEVGGVIGKKAMLAEIEKARRAGDSVGGRIHCRVTNLPASLGGALFDGLESELSAALFAIPGVKGVSFGDSFTCRRGGSPRRKGRERSSFDAESLRVYGRGSSFNDAFCISNGAVVTATNRAGGILGGRATGMPIEFDVILKPTPTIFKPQASVDLATMRNATCEMKGRHDPCIVRRAVPVVEAMAAFVLADAILADEAAHPRICLTLTGKTLAEDIGQYRSQRYFTDMVELRVDLLTVAERAKAAEFPAMLWKASRPGPVVPVIFTFRRKSDGGAFVGSEKVRERFFRGLLSMLSVDAVAHRVEKEEKDSLLTRRASASTGTRTDFASTVGRGKDSASTWGRGKDSASTYFDFEDDFNVPALEKLAREKGVTIIRSRHDFSYKTGQTRFIRKSAGEIAKFAFLPRGLKDVAQLFDESFASRREICSRPCRREICSRQMEDEFVLIGRGKDSASTWGRGKDSASTGGRGKDSASTVSIAMGPQGLASRVLAARLGAPWTYASVGGLEGLGHVTPHELVRDYRFRSISRAAALYGVTGWPLQATRSPELHNAMFAAADRDAVMIPFPARTAREAIDFMNAMGMKGLAVTIPHKQAVMPLLDRIDPAARRVGAVNTVVREGSKLVGYNTDVAGFAEAIVGFVGGRGKDSASTGTRTDFASTGGRGKDSASTGTRTDFAFTGDAEGIPRLRGLRAAVLGAGGASKAVVCALKKLGARVTVYGRHPPRRKSDPHFANCGLNVARDFDLIVNATPVDPIPDYRFTGRELVYDLVYVPAETPLLKRARAAGCRVENGFSMLIAQAREQQRIWRIFS